MTEKEENQLFNIMRLFYPDFEGKVSEEIDANALYLRLSEATGKKMPWGSLTGIRPTKLAYEMPLKDIGEKFFVSPPKLELLGRILAAQRGYLSGEGVNLYINIPVCPTRCGYCSFAAATVKECKKYLDKYVDTLIEEIRRDGEKLCKIYTVYIGGGTPTVLSANQLDRVLAAVGDHGVEFTCEAGRPDSIDDEKLAVMKARGVNRICINPQSFNDATLHTIGRAHTAADTVRAYELAQKYGFVINTDLIAGLPNENLDDFEYSLDRTLELSPHNVTVHTLSRKRGSEYAKKNISGKDISNMIDFGYEKLTVAGYEPYYLYRQKSQLGALENTGYTKPGFQCRNNISVMEETVSVLAAGAGGISKKIQVARQGNLITRYANCKDIKLYLEEFEQRYQSKAEFFFWD